jgi:hypothetical protein
VDIKSTLFQTLEIIQDSYSLSCLDRSVDLVSSHSCLRGPVTSLTNHSHKFLPKSLLLRVLPIVNWNLKCLDEGCPLVCASCQRMCSFVFISHCVSFVWNLIQNLCCLGAGCLTDCSFAHCFLTSLNCCGWIFNYHHMRKKS